MSAKSHKMCKSPPKNLPSKPAVAAKPLPELGSYEVLNTNCTMVGSNNLHLDSKLHNSSMKSPDTLLKKPHSPRTEFIHNAMLQNVNKFTNFNQLRNLQPSPTPNTSGFVQTVRTTKSSQNTSFNNGLAMAPSPSAYSNPSPGSYPSAAVSPYNVQISSPANSVSSGAIKSPVPSPQNIRPPTPQPILPQAFQQLPTLSGQNLVQIIHAAPQNSGPTAYTNHPVLAQRTIIAPQSGPQQQLSSAPLLKIKPPQNILPKPPSAPITPSGGGSVSKPARVSGGAAPGQGVAPGMGLVPVPGPALLLNQVPLLVGGGQLILRPGTPTAAAAPGKGAAPQLVLQSGTPSPGPQVILQPGHAQQRAAQAHGTHLHQPQQLVRVLTANGMLQSLNPLGGLNALGPTYIMQQQHQVQSLPQVQQQQQQPTSQVQSLAQQAPPKPHYIQSQSVVPGTVPPSQSPQHGSVPQEQLPPPKKKPKKKKKNKEPKMDLANIMKLSGIGDEDDVMFESDTSESAVSTEPSSTNSQPPKLPRPAESPPVNTTNPLAPLGTDFPKRIGNIHISALDNGGSAPSPKQTRSDLTDKQQTFGHSQISVQQSLSDINAINQNLAHIGLINQNHTNFLTGNNQILSNHPNFSTNSPDNQHLANILQALNQQNFSLLNGSVSQATSIPGLTTFPNTLPTSQYQKFPTVLPTMSIAQTLTSSDSILTGLSKSQPSGNFPQPTPKQPTSATNPLHFNIPNAIPNIQVQNFCGNNSNLILNQLNQGANILAPNIPNFSGNITINNSLIPNTNLTLPGNLMPNFLPANLVQPAQEMNAGFGGNVQRTGGFKLALSEDGRLILQHDPNLNQDIQSQLLLQSIFGINLQGGNLVLTSVNNTPSLPPPPKPVTISEPLKKPPQPLDHCNTKTTNIIQAAIPSVKTEQNLNPEPLNQQPTQGNTPPNNYSYIVNLTPDQLETLKRNGQLTVNGQTIFMHRPNVTNKEDKSVKSPKGKTPKKPPKNNFENKTAKTVLQEHLNIKNQNVEKTTSVVQSVANQTIINSLQSPIVKNQHLNNQHIIISGQITSCTSTEPKQTTTESIYPQNSQNIICIQPNKTINKINEHQQVLKQTMMKQSPSDQLIILEHKQNTTHIHKDPIKPEPEMIFSNNHPPFINGIDTNALNVEQFLTNLNINPTNLGQLISQKLSQELPSGVDPKIVNISAGPTAGHIVAKIDISDGMQQILNSGGPTAMESATPASSEVLPPPLVSMGGKQETADVFNTGTVQIPPEPPQQPPPQLHLPPAPPAVQSQPQVIQPPVQSQPQVIQPPVQSQPQQQLPALIIGGSTESVPTQPSATVPAAVPDQSAPASSAKVYQRVQTIQLTPQKQQLLKSVQLQIHALSARLQQKTGDGDQPEIHTALRHLFLEQQKILATGKVIPNITQPIASNNATCTMDTPGTQTVPVTSASKTNGTFLTSLLQQPVVSHNQTQKVYYHHGNQIIAINPQLSTSFNTLPTSGSSVSTTPPSLTPVPTSSSSTQTVPTPIPPVVPTKPPQHTNNNKKLPPPITNTNPTNPTKPANQLAEVQSAKEVEVLPEPVKMAPVTQMAPAVKRIVKPSFSKAQLIEQQLQTDQNGAMNPDITTPFASKADAVKRLVRYHCYKQPVLSPKDLAKADEIFELTARHFIDKFRCMVTKYQALLLKESMREVQTSELMMIDRMFLAEEQQSFIKFQSDLKLQNELELCEPGPAEATDFEPFIKTEPEVGSERFEETNTDFNIKCGVNYFSDESCDSNHFQPEFDEFIGGLSSTNEKSQEKVKNVQKNYNTTKIIGNFEIEINNKGCNSQESFTKNFRQKVEKNENFSQKDEDYDEWLCIQRELGYFPPENKSDGGECESNSEHATVGNTASDILKSGGKMEKHSAHKRSSSDRNCLESLKKYRVEKHNSKVKKTGSIIGEVKFEVRIEHKKVFPEQQPQQKQVKSEEQQKPMKRTQCFDYTKSDAGDIFSKRSKQMQEVIKQEAAEPEDKETSETFDRSIDEQVQSAIDSILNLQQITSMTEKPDVQQPEAQKGGSKRDELFPGSSPEDTLDEAVKSILS